TLDQKARCPCLREQGRVAIFILLPLRRYHFPDVMSFVGGAGWWSGATGREERFGVRRGGRVDGR
ncbi:MAG: hypothetical protein Q9181_007469, partial [Wetmoreana brouardii]